MSFPYLCIDEFLPADLIFKMEENGGRRESLATAVCSELSHVLLARGDCGFILGVPIRRICRHGGDANSDQTQTENQN